MIPKYFIQREGYKEIIRTDKKYFVCPFCKEEFRGLAYHTYQKHGVTSKRLKRIMGLKSNYQLITDSIKDRHREIVMANKDSHIKENLLLKGQKTRYKKGDIGHIKAKWSNQAIKEMSIKGKKQFKNLWRWNK